MLSNVRFNGVKSYKKCYTSKIGFKPRNGRVKGQSSQSYLPMTYRCNNPIHYSVKAWIQAFGAKIFGIVWLDKRHLWLVNGWIPSTNHNAWPPKRTQKALHPKPVPLLLFVSEVGNHEVVELQKYMYIGNCYQEKENAIGQVTIGVSFNLTG